jgi:hypothetical protein
MYKHPSFLSDFNETSIFSADFPKFLISNYIKVRPVEAEFYVEGQMDMTKLVVAFTICRKAPKMAMYRQQV